MQKFPYFVKFRSLEGIDDFYEEMQNEGYELKKLWPSSTYTEYWLTKDEVNKVTSKPFVESCKLPPELDSTVMLLRQTTVIQVEKFDMYVVYMVHRLIH